jgi:tRNA threonylcarbamoyladenosine biosynthesis protein TsaE
MNKVVFQTKSSSETIRIGKKMGSLLLPGDVVALAGELGTGKTQFIKGLAEGAGVGKSTYISSPSFTLINEYAGKAPFYHIDLYRLKSEKEAGALGLEEYFQGEGITAIEWADKIPSLLPQEMLWIHIRYTGKRTRSFEIIGKGKHFEQILRGSRSQGAKGSSKLLKLKFLRNNWNP